MKVPDRHKRALADLASLQDGTMSALAAALAGAPPVLLPQDLAGKIGGRVDLELPKLQALMEMLISMSGSRTRRGATVAAFVAEVIAAAKDAEVDVAPDKWEALAARLALLLPCPSIGITSKALDVLTQHEHVYARSRVLTDLRPVFDTDVISRPRAGVIVHQLEIRYYQDSGERRFFVALDSEDVKELREVVERAAAKEERLCGVAAEAGIAILRMEPKR